MANTSAIWQQAAHIIYQLSSPIRSTRAHLLMKNTGEFSGKEPGEWKISRKNDKTERATGLARKTRGHKKGK